MSGQRQLHSHMDHIILIVVQYLTSILKEIHMLECSVDAYSL